MFACSSRTLQLPLAAADEPDRIAVPLVWAGLDDATIVYANSFLCQFDQDLQTFILSFGQSTPPVLVGTPDEVKRQAQEIEFIQVKPLLRVSLSEVRFEEFRQALGANLDQLEHARKVQPGDPR
jgi:hypothetical protein